MLHVKLSLQQVLSLVPYILPNAILTFAKHAAAKSPRVIRLRGEL